MGSDMGAAPEKIFIRRKRDGRDAGRGYNGRRMIRRLELAAPLALLAARAFTLSPLGLTRDPVALLSLLWFFLAADPKGRAAEPATLVAAAVLLVSTAAYQLPYALDILRLLLQ
jgi:hypothetical protein